MLSVRIVTSDHSMDDPIPGLDVTYSSFRGAVVKKVPVIRIFGPDSAGVKTCLHIHGVFPYIFIPCVEAEPDGKVQYQIASSLDLALNISLGQASSSSQHVFKVVHVSGIPFYGYHQSSHQFFKIYFYNPAMVKKAAELLQSGAILNQVYQVHHCHVPYNLQFFIDYNLRGMDYISLEAVKYRRHPSSRLTPDFHDEDVLHVPRISVSEVEADGLAADIMNVRAANREMNPGLADIWDDERQRRRAECRSSQITPPSSQQRPPRAATESEVFFKNRIRENLRLMNSQNQDSPLSSTDSPANINTSIPYPVEVPRGATLLNASYLDSHVVAPSHSRPANLNESLVDESLVLSLMSASQKQLSNESVLLDSQDLVFAGVLGEMQEDRAQVDDDSMLGSQLEREELEEDNHFLGVNHQMVNTLLEENVQNNSEESTSKESRQMWQESFWSGVDAIPQLDGTLESPDSTPGTSSSETLHLMELQPPNYWPFPELAALEPCNDGVAHTNGHCEPLEEDLMDLSYSTATYSNISEPYNRVLLGDPAFTLPPSATPSELGDCMQTSHEFATNDPHFEAELMENLNFPDIGDLLEPTLGFSPVKDARPVYALEVNGSAEKTGSKRKHSKAGKTLTMSQQLNAAMGEHAVNHSGADTVFQQPQPVANGGSYYHQFPQSEFEASPIVKKPKMAKKSSKKKTSAVPAVPETVETDSQTSVQTDVTTPPVKKVSSKRKSVSSSPCVDWSCYEDAINNAVVRGISECDSSAESCASDGGATPANLTPANLAPANVTPNSANYDDAINEAVNRGLNECADSALDETVPTSQAEIEPGPIVATQSLGDRHKTVSDAVKILSKIRIKIKVPAQTKASGDGHCQPVPASATKVAAPSVTTKVTTAAASKVTLPASPKKLAVPATVTKVATEAKNAILKKSLPGITLTSVKREPKPSVAESTNPAVVRTKSLPGISLTVNKKKSEHPAANHGPDARPPANHGPDARPAAPLGGRQLIPSRTQPSSTSTPVVNSVKQPSPVATKDEKKTHSHERRESRAKTKTEPSTPKPEPPSLKASSKRSALALVRREDDLTLAQLIKLGKTRAPPPQPDWSDTRNETHNSFEIAVSKTTSLAMDTKTCEKGIRGPGTADNVIELGHQTVMSVKDLTDCRSGVDCCLKVVSSSADNMSLADFLAKATEVYNSAVPMKLTMLKGMGEHKFQFEAVKIQALNGPNYKPAARAATRSETAIARNAQNSPKTAKRDRRRKPKSSGKAKPLLSLASREIMDARLIALFEARTGRVINRFAYVSLARMTEDFLRRHRAKKVVKPFKIPCVDGGVDSDSSSSDDGGATSGPSRRRKGRYRPLAVQFEKSPSRSGGASPGGATARKKRTKRGSYTALDVKFDRSPSSRRGATSSSFGIQPNVCKNAAALPPDLAAARRPSDDLEAARRRPSDDLEAARRRPSDDLEAARRRPSDDLEAVRRRPSDDLEITRRLPSDDLEVEACCKSQSECDDPSVRSVQSEAGCDQDSLIGVIKTAKKKLSFPATTVDQEASNVASSFSETNISEIFPARRSSFDIFQESNSPLAQSPADDLESVGALELVSDEEINELGIVSFYDNTHIFPSPSETTFHGSPESSFIVSSGETPATCRPDEPTCRPDEPTCRPDEPTCCVEPVVYHQEPFYSDPADVTPGIQVGHRVVKLLFGRRQPPGCKPGPNWSSKTVTPAPDWPGLAVITPCQPPPSAAEVLRWTQARRLLKEQQAREAGTSSQPSQDSASEATPPIASQSPPTLPAERWTQSRRLRKEYQACEAVTGSHPSQDSASEATPPIAPQSPPTLPAESKNATSTPQKTRRSALVSPTFTPIVEVRAKLRRTKRRSFMPQEPAIEEADESASLDVPSTSRETPRRVGKRRRSSLASVEDPSLHKLLLQSQFRQQLASPRRLSSGCQIEGVQDNTFGFRMSLENLQDAKALTRHQHVTIMSMELHVQTRGDLRPDPAHDPVRAVFFLVVNDVPETSTTPRQEAGALVVADSEDFLSGCALPGPAWCVASERELVDQVVAVVRRTDPDILCGYETEMLSWGYLIQRAATLQVNLCPLLSRVPTAPRESRRDNDDNDGALDGPTDVRLPGRVLLNVWRLMKSEIPLMNYTFENVVFHVLHQRVPLHSFRSLSQWWEHRSRRQRHLTYSHYTTRVHGLARIMDQLDLVGRTSELARIFGIQFYEVFSRGSQFRVESMMLRLAKPLNYVPVSPSIHQRAQMRAPECVPLIMEPESAFYADPVIVLDFQSLYPSIIMAYNYCFSTCLGRVEHLGKRDTFAFGCTSLRVPPRLVRELRREVNVSPCGVAFVGEGVRRGVLPRMLQEILETRLMVKKSMKEHAGDKTLQRVLHSRQLGLKLIANVTYGYTSANFSGRMPCVEVGDSVVSKGRETLERAVRLVQQTERWGAKVVYGDTDSLFVLVKGRSREQAFAIGAEIAEAVTRDNPKPVKLKLEKVYHPCILQTKKRYVGYLYESPEQREPRYDAKGIETVRRDSCPAVAKMLEKCLRLLFETRDVSLVKRYVCRQFDKLLRGRANVRDLVFAREYRGMAGYKPGACVPALELTRRWLRLDRRSEPRVGERVPYVIVAGAPGLPLIRLVRSPHELLSDSSLRINAVYYVTRAIAPALNRCLLLIGADVLAWFAGMPRRSVSYLPTTAAAGQKKSTISQYFATTDCAACSRPTTAGLCAACAGRPQATVLALADKVRLWERSHARITQVCESCVGRSYSVDCTSLDCPVMFRKCQAFRDLEQAPFVRQLMEQY